MRLFAELGLLFLGCACGFAWLADRGRRQL